MGQWVALLRGVNVGGGNKVPMADLRALARGLGWTGVQSCIASGNLVFRATGEAGALAAALRAAMVAGMGVDVPVLVLPGDTMRAALAACPFDPDEGRQVHVFFGFGDPVIDQTLYAALRSPTEELLAQGRLLWLHAPGGIGRSKLAARLDKVVGGAAITGRNLNTLRKLVDMLDAKPPA